MSFSHVQGNIGSASSGTTCSCVLGSNPTQGNLVCVMVSGFVGLTLGTVKDSNGNSYTITPNSPSAVQDTTSGSTWLAYLLSAPANATNTIIATFSSGTITGCDVYADEFSYSGGGSGLFDVDVAGFDTSGSQTNVNTPTITPAGAGELLYGGVSPADSITAVNSPWVVGGGGFGGGSNQGATEYILSSASGPTAASYTMGLADPWDSMAMAFKFVPAAPVSSGSFGGGDSDFIMGQIRGHDIEFLE